MGGQSKHANDEYKPPPAIPRRSSFFRRWTGDLGWRLVGLLTLTLVLLLGASGWLALELHRRHLEGLVREHVAGMGETILAGTRSSMLVNDQDEISRLVASFAGRGEVRSLRIVDAEGIVRHSAVPDDVGSQLPMEAAPCAGCHTHGNGTPTVSGPLFYSRTSTSLGLVVPVRNEPACAQSDCHVHPETQRKLGILDLEVSTTEMKSALHEARLQLSLLLLLTIVVAPAAVGVLAWRVVHRPLHSLLKGIHLVGRAEPAPRLVAEGTGEVAELSRAFNDLTDRVTQAQEELRRANESLEDRVREKTLELERTRDGFVFAEKMASLGKLAAVVAHEINNPLAGILVYTKVLRKKHLKGTLLDNREEVNEMLATMERETARCGDIVRNLLLFSRRQEGTFRPEKLNELVERTLRLIGHKADLASVRIERALDPDLPPLHCIPDQIEQAILAVVMNGIEAMPDGGTLTVRTRARDGNVRIEIQDTGVGIPPEVRNRIFEPFFSTKSGEAGTGLGLSVMYGIVQRHEGRTDFMVVPGEGTTFWLELPLELRPQDAGAEGTHVAEV